ncbi:MAG: nucleoside triphosphate pyrophosphohydrolase family protein [Bryobacterales bacterium]|nr:nucleoside triphosphate pyrophosphohydrolase family protein [Bryobacterales bacterium]
MTFDDYQNQAGETAIYPNWGRNLVYPTLGLAGESGEVAEKVKKLIRDQGVNSPEELDAEARYEFRMALAKELGDVLWYVAAICHECGMRMEAVADLNLAKLASRKQRGVLNGSGDAR